MPDDQPQPATRSPRWMRIALVLSLAVNLAIVGAAAGALYRGAEMIRKAAPARDVALPYARAVDPEDRHALRRAMETRRPPRGGRIADYATALEILRADPFDADALRAHLQSQTQQAQTRIVAGQEALLDYLAGLTAEERMAYAERLEHALNHHRGGRLKGPRSERP